MQSDARPGDAASEGRKARITAPENVKVVPKPWGEERWLAHTERYAGKLLVLKKGHRLSLQYHERKHETQYVDSGRIKYTLGSVDRPGEYEEVSSTRSAASTGRASTKRSSPRRAPP